MEEENEQEIRAGIDADQPPAPVAGKAAPITIRNALVRVLRKRVKKFVALVPEVVAGANPKVVHDARVWSRRLQQAASAFFPKPRSGKVRRLRRAPRRIRRALGEWRNCDVVLAMVARQERRARSEAKRRAWSLVRDYLLQKRSKQVIRAAKKLQRQDLADYAALARSLLDQAPDESPDILLQRLCEGVQGAWVKWQSALARAQETGATNDLHVLRIATKALRYRTELLDDVGDKQWDAQLQWLAELQEALGVWHDRQVLDQAVAQAIARPETLLNELQTARILLAELEKDRKRGPAAVHKIFRLASEHPGRREMENWRENHSRALLTAGLRSGNVSREE